METRPRRSRRPLQSLLIGIVPLLTVCVAAAGQFVASAPSAVPITNNAARGIVAHSRAVVTGQVRDITLPVDPWRRGLGAYSDTWGDNVVFDKNRDGIPDILLSNHRQPWQIWLGNRRGGFTFDRALPAVDRHNCAVADFGGPHGTPPDGRPDLYCVRGAQIGTINNKRNSLFIQRADGGFTDVVTSWSAVDGSGRGRTVSILHIRGGSRPSLFVGNDKGVRYPSLDHIYANTGRRFVEVRTAALPSEHASKCSDTADFNRDGRQDFVTCSSSSLRLYENLTTRGGPITYREVAQLEGIPPVRQADAELVDMNRDGWPDLVTVRQEMLEVRLNRHRAPYFSTTDFSLPLYAAHSFCVGRANADTAPDLLVVQGIAPHEVRQRRDWMLINSGSGTAFTSLPVPQPPYRNGKNGSGDTCTAIPDYRGGRSAWTINNGFSGGDPYSHLGYRQLVIYTP